MHLDKTAVLLSCCLILANPGDNGVYLRETNTHHIQGRIQGFQGRLMR